MVSLPSSHCYAYAFLSYYKNLGGVSKFDSEYYWTSAWQHGVFYNQLFNGKKNVMEPLWESCLSYIAGRRERKRESDRVNSYIAVQIFSRKWD